MKTSDRYTIFALLWSIWGAVHLYAADGLPWLGILLTLMGFAFFVASLVADTKESGSDQ